MINKPIVVLGAGGHAKVLVSTLLLANMKLLGITEREHCKADYLLGIKIIGDDECISRFSPGEILLVNGLGSVGRGKARRNLYEKFKKLGYSFANVIHPSAIIANDACINDGAQIMAGSVIQPGCTLGENTIINTKASIDHDCILAKHIHVAPGATISGGVKIGEGSHIGTGAVIIQGICIGANCIIGAGAVVIKDVPDETVVVGVPAKEVSR